MSPNDNAKHIFNLDSLGLGAMEAILDEAARLCAVGTFPSRLAGKIAGLCFFQPSTRTRVGFDAAMKRLGGATVSLTEPRAVPRSARAESVEDTVRVVSAYCDVIVLRHADTATAERATRASVAPVINAGSGMDHHPTQALIDLFQIRRRFDRLAGLRVGIVGNLATSRAARSLVRALRRWPPAELRLMAPPGRRLPTQVLGDIDPSTITTRDRLDPAGLDVLYVAGLPNPDDGPPYPSAVRRAFAVDADTLRAMPEQGVVLCPLPRLDEIDSAVDGSSKAVYFHQSDDGLWVRMAVLLRVLA